MLIQLVLGDWSDDGHGKHSTVLVESSHPLEKLIEAYIRGKQEIGFDLISEVAEDYDDGYLYAEQWKKLKQAGWYEWADWEFEFREGDTRTDLYEGEFVKLYFFFIWVGNPEIKIEETKIPEIKIGGYGLYE